MNSEKDQAPVPSSEVLQHIERRAVSGCSSSHLVIGLTVQSWVPLLRFSTTQSLKLVKESPQGSIFWV